MSYQSKSIDYVNEDSIKRDPKMWKKQSSNKTFVEELSALTCNGKYTPYEYSDGKAVALIGSAKYSADDLDIMINALNDGKLNTVKSKSSSSVSDEFKANVIAHKGSDGKIVYSSKFNSEDKRITFDKASLITSLETLVNALKNI